MDSATRLANALAAGARAFLREYEEGISEPTGALPPLSSTARAGVSYDPLTDEPPYRPRLKQHGGSDDENRMVTVAFLGAVARLNAEHETGATAEDIHRAALRAGYPRGGQDVVGWTIRDGRRGAIEVRDGLRYLSEDGHKWLRSEAEYLKIEIKGDINPIPIPPEEA